MTKPNLLLLLSDSKYKTKHIDCSHKPDLVYQRIVIRKISEICDSYDNTLVLTSMLSHDIALQRIYQLLLS